MAKTLSFFGMIVLRALAGWAVLHGVLTALNDMERWSSPAYDIVSILPPQFWGVTLIVGGILVLLASFKGTDWKYYQLFKTTGLWILATWFFTIAIGFSIAALGHYDVSYAAGSRDFFIGFLCVVLTKASEPKVLKGNNGINK